jgi:predicted anti-sigma-YlaC factor YlaD
VNDCVNAEVRDALPDLLHGRLSELDTATMKAHVESCADCRAELAIMREASESLPIAPRMNAAKISASIPPYAGVGVTRQAPSRARIFSRAATLRIAVATALVAIGGWAFSNMRGNDALRQSASTVSAIANAPENVAPVASPSTIDAGEASTAASGETQVASLSLVETTADLTDADLEKLMAELDGMESLPSAEPQAITITDDDFGTSDEDSLR